MNQIQIYSKAWRPYCNNDGREKQVVIAAAEGAKAALAAFSYLVHQI